MTHVFCFVFLLGAIYQISELAHQMSSSVNKSIFSRFHDNLHCVQSSSVATSSYSVNTCFRLFIHAYFCNRCFKQPGYVYTRYMKMEEGI